MVTFQEAAPRKGQAPQAENGPRKHAFTVDVEDYFHVQAFHGRIDRSDWGQLQSRFEANTDRLLDLLARHQVRGTFFVLGWVAERAPELVRKIGEAGHELGCHSYDHAQVFRQTPGVFRQDVRRAKRLIEDAAGKPVAGYRAPTFSINTDSLWAYRVLEEEGYTYSSSVYPVRHDLYGIPDAPRVPFRVIEGTGAASIVELPLPTVRLPGASLPGGGGGYFRLLPLGVSRFLMQEATRQLGLPFIFYCHPWEIDPEQPRVEDISFKSRIRHYTNLDRMEGRIAKLLEAHEWTTMAEAYGAYLPLPDAGLEAA